MSKYNFEFFYLTISHVECVSADSGTSYGAKPLEVFLSIDDSQCILVDIKCQALIIHAICENRRWYNVVLWELSPLGRHANGFMDWKQLPTVAYLEPCCWICTSSTWWCHQVGTFSALLAPCEGNSPVTGEFPSQSQWRGALMFSYICDWTNSWVNNRDAGDLRRHSAHYDITVMRKQESVAI